MTKDEIRAELRRSACEDVEPSYDVDDAGLDAIMEFITWGEAAQKIGKNHDRIFLLLVAEAL